MLKIGVSHWYDFECDNPKCERLVSMDYGHCLGWATPGQATEAALNACWERTVEHGVVHFYCFWCKQLANKEQNPGKREE